MERKTDTMSVLIADIMQTVANSDLDITDKETRKLFQKELKLAIEDVARFRAVFRGDFVTKCTWI